MDDYKYFEASTYAVRAKALWPVLLAVGVVSASYLLASSQGLTLLNTVDGGDDWAVRLSDSAKTTGVTFITLAALLVLGSRRRLSAKYRLKEAITVIGAIVLFAGGGAMLNEHKIKPMFEVPRPNIEWLAGQPGAAEFDFNANTFYARRSSSDRARFMQRAINASSDPISRVVRAHWLSETGYSFPSGHAFASFFVTTFLLFFSTSFVATRRQLLFYLLLPWAVLVSASRVMLHVHTPFDVVTGAAQGVILGIVAWWFVRLIIRKLVQVEIGN